LREGTGLVSRESVEERVKAAVARVFRTDPERLTADTRFVQDLMAKSLNIIELTAVLEDEFGVEIPMWEARKRRTIGEAADLITALLEKKAV